MKALLSLLKNVKFPRSLWPEGRVFGLPILVVFSDGEALAFDAVAYIRCELESGEFWSRIIMAKCLEGEVQIKSHDIVCALLHLARPDFQDRLLNRGDKVKKVIRVSAWGLRVAVKD